MKLFVALFALLAACSAYMMAARPIAQQPQCQAPAVAARTPAPSASLFANKLEVDLDLDNPAVAEDKDIMPARKCGFCMG